MKKNLTFISFIFYSSLLLAWPRSVFLELELQNADKIVLAKILKYDSSTLIYKDEEGHDTLKSKISKHHEKPTFDKSASLTGYWPEAGSKVLIVVKNGCVSLFASIEKERYRFWSPYYTGSNSLFYFKDPGTCIEGQSCTKVLIGSQREEFYRCTGGCYYPISTTILNEK